MVNADISLSFNGYLMIIERIEYILETTNDSDRLNNYSAMQLVTVSHQDKLKWPVSTAFFLCFLCVFA